MIDEKNLSTVVADEEDLTVVDSKLKFKNRKKEPNDYTGKGYKILRLRSNGTINTLYQADVMDTNTVYEIRYDFDLGGATLEIPINSVLSFKGGSLSNGIVQGNNTIIAGYNTAKFDNIEFTGSFIADAIWIEWNEDINNPSIAYPYYKDETGNTIRLAEINSTVVENLDKVLNKVDGYSTFVTNRELRTPLWYDEADDTWRFADGIRYNVNRVGTTDQRPTGIPIGFVYFDTTINNPVWYDGEKWISYLDAELLKTLFSAEATAVDAENASASVNLNNGKFTFNFELPKGKDGRDGIDALSGRNIFVYKESDIQPDTPVGGGLDVTTNTIIYPEGWSGYINSTTSSIWMSVAIVNGNGQITGTWSTPIRITGVDGQPGKDGKTIEYIYKLTTTSESPTKPTISENTADYIPDGWTDHPNGIDESNRYEWFCIRTLVDDTWSDWSEPSLWACYGINGTDGDGVEYIFKRTQNGTSPSTPESVNTDDFIPEGWTDDPYGVDSTHKYEWVCKRKYYGKLKQWGDYSQPALWSKFGADGEAGPEGPQGPAGNAGPAGHDGVDGLPGINFGIRYSIGTETDPVAKHDAEELKKANPSGWSEDVPQVTEDYPYVWCIQARINPSDGSIEGGSWKLIRLSGINGLDGAVEINRSQIIYPMGIYDVNTHYICDLNKAPYVYDPIDGNFWVLNVVMDWLGTEQNNANPSERPDTWVKFEGYEAIYSKIGIIANGLIGYMVFNDEFMFSQYGIDNEGYATNHYEEFNKDNPMDSSNSFRPNFLVNCITGEMWTGAGNVYFSQNGKMTAKNVDLTGKINATSGVFSNITSKNGSWMIDDDGNVTVDGTITASSGSKIGNMTVTSTGALSGYSLMFENLISGFNITDVSESYIQNFIVNNIDRGSTFALVFNGVLSTSTHTVYLPSYDDLPDSFGNISSMGVMFHIKIFCPNSYPLSTGSSWESNDDIFRITPKSGDELISNSGSAVSYVQLTKGNILELYGTMVSTIGTIGNPKIKYYVCNLRQS